MSEDYIFVTAGYVENFARLITPELVAQTTPIIQTQILQSLAKYAHVCIPRNQVEQAVFNIIESLKTQQELIGENGLLNITESCHGLQNIQGKAK